MATDSHFPEGFYTRVNGLITEPEAETLYKLASEVPAFGNIVEIGAYQGRGTCALAIGAKTVQGVKVYSVDHHPDYTAGDTHFNEQDLQAYYANIAHYELGSIVRTINLPSEQAFVSWQGDIDLLWIDGDHEYEAVSRDFALWGSFATVVALHDTAGHHEGVSRLVTEIIQAGTWAEVSKVDSITVFKWGG